MASTRSRTLISRTSFAVAKPSYAVLVLLSLMVGSLAGLLFVPPIAQDRSYHDFSDQRTLLGIPNCDAFGFQPGARSKITILDVDTTNERVLADAQIRHGGSPLKVRTASGKFHVYYRHNGEPRKNSAMARTADRSAWAQRVCGGSAIAGGERAIS